ncbi:PepSY-associated TM helix domain-containing protein [Opitutus terrae]|uniref:PepSY-associated TM helix domain protein n=1 Tax=Opitutus terrae (strain DSM 11246 / JCM 15787 / PB90-1) TaxID=452637 RepID=B1ZQT1_OPITP|nr:PepSY-associated TM helix domain-containing protein [Opitutus terrae]ACB77829.1 PepSY-associated TM helix domain protein [Opitutus terrae PB90-1]
MTIRRTIFWLHLIAGIIAGLSIAVMCFTGVTLAFEKQLVTWSERDARQIEPPMGSAARLPVEELLARVRAVKPDAKPGSLTISSNPRSAVAVSLGRDATVFVDPYAGAVRRPASTRMHDFLHVMEDWHRFLALTGDHRPTGKLINGICNLAFFVLAATGLYLWIPRRWSWRSIRGVVWFQRGLEGKPRDFNWHNVIGLWSAPVLIVLTLTAVPISFRWGNALVYRLVGEEPPARQGPPGTGSPAVELPAPTTGAQPLSRDAQFAAVRAAFPDWEQITLRLSVPGSGVPGARITTSASAQRTDAVALAAEPATFVVKTPPTWPRTATTTVTLNPFTGDVIRREAFSDQSAGRQLRSWTRFLHTGEALGWAGQLAAGAASLGGCFLVYTGLALSWRRFFGKRGAKTPATAS